jgi:mono/diheme cytochrome c family protein
MLPAAMPRRTFSTLLAGLVAAAAGLSGCSFGESDIDVAKSDPLYEGAQIFNQRCGGCHTFDEAGTEGSAVKANSREYKDGPNFSQRKEQYDAVLYAIRNGGFSSGPMPQNIAVGHDAEIVACFVATYSGRKGPEVPSPTDQPTAGAGGGETDCQQQLSK